MGANLPDSDVPIRDDELIAKVFGGRPAAGLLFTHPHGDHYGLYKKVPADIPMYIGPMAKEILTVLVSRLDYISEEKGLPAVERMQTYQAEVILTAMRGMERKGHYPQYQASKEHCCIRVRGRSRWGHLRGLGLSLKKTVGIIPVADDSLKRDGFVMLVRKNTNPARKSVFEEMRDEFYPLDGQIIYSMWDGYLKPEHADQHLIDFIGGRPIEQLHTSGHAYVETIARLIETVQPKVIVPMHTQRADEFSSIPEFAPWADRVKVLTDGKPLNLDEL